MSKQFLIILAAIIVVFGGLVVVNKQKNDNANSTNNDSTKRSQHIIKGDSGVKVVEFGDFQCPGCASVYPLFKQLKQKYADKVTFQFVNYPLTEIHPFALLAARSAEAASMQGKFWEMHDILYENQRAWAQSSNPSELFDSYAKSIGLDIDKFKKDAKSEQVNNIIQADKAFAKQQDIQATPSFELDGKKIEPKNQTEFEKLIDEALSQKKSEKQ